MVTPRAVRFVVTGLSSVVAMITVLACPAQPRQPAHTHVDVREPVDASKRREAVGCYALAIGQWVPRPPSDVLDGRLPSAVVRLEDSIVAQGRFWRALVLDTLSRSEEKDRMMLSELAVWLPGPDSVVVGAATLGRLARIAFPYEAGLIRGRARWGTDVIEPLLESRANAYVMSFSCDDVRSLRAAAARTASAARQDTGDFQEWQREVLSALGLQDREVPSRASEQ